MERLVNNYKYIWWLYRFFVYLSKETNTNQTDKHMTTSKGYTLTADQNAAIVALKAVQQIEENNNFANGDLWNNIQNEIEVIEAEAEYADIKEDVLEYERINGIG